MGINRNIVECKSGDCTCHKTWRQLCINRNIVECKLVCSSHLCKLFSMVLIETLWNVNFDEVLIKSMQETVLIETLWNVNTFEFACSLCS